MTQSTHSEHVSDPTVGVLRVVDGAHVAIPRCTAATLSPRPRASRSRAGEKLLLLLDLSGPTDARLFDSVCEVVADTYWSASGSVTAALRRAALAACQRVFRHNLKSGVTDRSYGGLAIVAWTSEEVFILQAGPVDACVLYHGDLECFPRSESSALVGTGPLADMRLHHTFSVDRDRLLVCSGSLLDHLDAAVLRDVLRRGELARSLEGLVAFGASVDFAAIVIELKPVQQIALPSRPESRDGLSQPRRTAADPSSLLPLDQRRPSETLPARVPASRVSRERSTPSIDWRKVLKQGGQSVGRGLTVFGAWIVGVGRTIGRRLLPGNQRTAQRRSKSPRPVPEENPRLMIPLAAGLPLLAALVVWAIYQSYGTSAVVGVLFDKALEELRAAQMTGLSQEDARRHWEGVLAYTDAIMKKQPGHADAASLEEIAQSSIDHYDSITRLQPVELHDFGSKAATTQLRLVLHNQSAYVLDAESGWVSMLDLRTGATGQSEDASIPIVNTGKHVRSGDGGTVGVLADCAWVDSIGDRRSDGLVILEPDGFLINYDPAWGAEEGTPHLTRFRLPAGASPETGSFDAIESFDGRIYVMDATLDQIWRYAPSGDTYPDIPAAYLGADEAITLTDAIDMAIDGNVYVLLQSGEIAKFLGGQRQQFVVREVPGTLSQTVALAVDPEDGSGKVFVADRGNNRIVVLGPDGLFEQQFRADDAFGALQSVVVDEGSHRLYVLSWGRLFVAEWP